MAAIETTVKERPILFSGPMVRAILEGRKTQTRRVIKPQPNESWMAGPDWSRYYQNGRKMLWVSRPDVCKETVCPYGKPGERLWVKENAYISQKHFGLPEDTNCHDYDGDYRVVGYSASMDSDSVRAAKDYGVKQRGAMLMPRWASRITLEVTEVRVERLNQISDQDCMREGITRPSGYVGGVGPGFLGYKKEFERLWDSINGKTYPWSSNPWVWVVSFRKIEPGPGPGQEAGV